MGTTFTIDTKLLDWLGSSNTGLSSRTIAHVLGQLPTGLLFESAFRPGDTPKDSSDFHRCRVLVELMGWEDRLQEVADVYPEWKYVAKHWEVLVELYEHGHKIALTALLWGQS